MVWDIDPWSLARVLGGFAALAGLTALFRAATRSLTWIVLGTLLALALDPLVSRTARRLGGRRRAVAVVLAGLAGMWAAVLGLLAPLAISEARDLQRDLPQVVARLGELPVIGDDLAREGVPERVEEWLADLPARLGADDAPVEDAARRVLGGTLATVATLLVAVTLLIDGHRLAATADGLVPHTHRARVRGAARLFHRVVGRYFAGSLLVAALAGLATLTAGLVLGVPLAPLAAVWVAVTNLIPQIGGALGGVVFVALGLADSPTTGFLAAVVFVAYLQFENHVLTPLVVGQAVDLSPPATMVAALVGVSAAGVPGALVAVPMLGAVKAFIAETRLGSTPRGEGEPAKTPSGTGPEGAAGPDPGSLSGP